MGLQRSEVQIFSPRPFPLGERCALRSGNMPLAQRLTLLERGVTRRDRRDRTRRYRTRFSATHLAGGGRGGTPRRPAKCVAVNLVR